MARRSHINRIAQAILNADRSDEYPFGITIQEIVDQMYSSILPRKERSILRMDYQRARFCVTIRKRLMKHGYPILTVNSWFIDHHPDWQVNAIPRAVFNELNSKETVIKMVAGGLDEDTICHGFLFCQWDDGEIRIGRKPAAELYENFVRRSDGITSQADANQRVMSITTLSSLRRVEGNTPRLIEDDSNDDEDDEEAA